MNKKRKEILKLIPYILIILLSFSLFLKPIADGDEIWNYNFAKCIADGKTPYKDFNMVQTPLSAYISAVFLILGNNSFIAFRLSGVILMCFVLIILYKLCVIISEDNNLSLVAVIFVFSIHYSIWIYNYNNLNLLILLVIIYLEISDKRLKNNKLKNIFIGLLYGLIILIKQSTGAVLLLGCVAILVIDYFLLNKKKKDIFIQLASSTIPIVIFLFIVMITDKFKDFYDYAISGIKYFTHRVTLIEFITSSPFGIFITFFIIFVLIKMIRNIYQNRKDKERIRNLIVLLIISLSGCIVAYPICDSIHMAVAFVPFVPCLFSCTKKLSVTKRQGIICVGVSLLVALFSVVQTLPNNSYYKKCELNNFEGLFINKELENNIECIDEYIVKMDKKGIQVKMLDKYAAVFMIPLDKYNKNFDMLLVGNLGSNSIKDLLVDTDTIYLVAKDSENLGYQAHYDLVNYVKDNYKKIDEVIFYEVYECCE